MKIAFHTNQICLRGTEIALYDYAYYNREILGNESIIISDKNANLDAYDKFKKEFDVLLYDKFSEVTNFISENNVDVFYAQKAGFNDGKLVPNVKNVVHAVFQYREPHGDKYAYISEWLSKVMSGGKLPSVPYIVDILKYDHNDNLRGELNIPSDATVFGYYGGSDSFNIPFVKNTIINIAKANEKIFFIFMNVDSFIKDQSNIIFLPGSYEFYRKISFINTCDGCLHARAKGESFGLTIAEFSIKNKPVIISTSSVDSAHIEMLGDKCIKYQDPNSLTYAITNFNLIKNSKPDWNAYMEYTPDKVMLQFKKIFLT